VGNIFEQHFPEELAGAEIDGVDVQMLSLDALRLLEYFAHESDFTKEQYAVLQEIEADLPRVIKGVEEKHKNYYRKLAQAIKDVHDAYHQKAKN